MTGNWFINRRQLLKAGGAAAVVGTAAIVGNSVTSASATAAHHSALDATSESSDLYDVAYCTVLNDGKWIGPRTADGSMDRTLVDDIIKKVQGYARPKFLRMTEASFDIGKEVPAAGTEEHDVLRDLVAAGIKLGVAINVIREPEPPQGCEEGRDDPVVPHRCVRTVDGIVAQTREIKKVGGGIYDWIFLDFAWDRTPAGAYGLDDLQQVVDGVNDAGWSRIMINATGFDSDRLSYLPRRTWGIAKHFQLLAGNHWQENVERVISGKANALDSADLDFADFVGKHRPESHAVLKFEIPTQIQEFRQLGSTDQNTLLKLWATAQKKEDYTMIYPLFVHGDKPLGNQKRQYDSRAAGTFWSQRALMYHYDRPAHDNRRAGRPR